MSKHTAGEWMVHATPESSYQNYLVKTGGKTVAIVSPAKGADEANANLIASAPELLEALLMLLPLAEAYLSSAPTHPDNAKLETARAAIAKAGRS